MALQFGVARQMSAQAKMSATWQLLEISGYGTVVNPAREGR